MKNALDRQIYSKKWCITTVFFFAFIGFFVLLDQVYEAVKPEETISEDLFCSKNYGGIYHERKSQNQHPFRPKKTDMFCKICEKTVKGGGFKKVETEDCSKIIELNR